jgi:hypothetical protein
MRNSSQKCAEDKEVGRTASFRSVGINLKGGVRLELINTRIGKERKELSGVYLCGYLINQVSLGVFED